MCIRDSLQSGELREKLVELEDETERLVAEIAQFLGAEAAYIDASNHDAATVRLVEGTDNLEECSLCLLYTSRCV